MNLVFWAERTEAEATKRFAFAPIVVKYVVKKFSEFQVVRKWWENARFFPENAKNKAENGQSRKISKYIFKSCKCKKTIVKNYEKVLTIV